MRHSARADSLRPSQAILIEAVACTAVPLLGATFVVVLLPSVPSALIAAAALALTLVGSFPPRLLRRARERGGDSGQPSGIAS